MKRIWIVSCMLVALLFTMNAQAKTVDTMEWLSGDYVGVGSINMERLVKRKIFDELMSFFLTDQTTKKVLADLETAGFSPKKDIKRIVVGVPADVERGAHLVLWETSKNLEEYRGLFSYDQIEKRVHNEVEYFATKRENECMAIFGDVLVLGSEARVKSVIDVKKAGGKGDLKKNSALSAQIKAASKNKDTWFAFALTNRIREKLGKNDPIADLSAEKKGKVNAADLKAGNLTIDFEKGLVVDAKLSMSSDESASTTAAYLSKTLSEYAGNEEVKALGVDFMLKGISASAKASNLLLGVKLSQDEFDQVIALVTSLAQSVPAPAKAKASK